MTSESDSQKPFWCETHQGLISARCRPDCACKAAHQTKIIASDLKESISKLLVSAVKGTDLGLLMPDGTVKWGIVEHRIHDQVDQALDMAKPAPADLFKTIDYLRVIDNRAQQAVANQKHPKNLRDD